MTIKVRGQRGPSGDIIYAAHCDRHKRPWISLGTGGQGTHNGAHQAAAEHRRAHKVADAKRAARREVHGEETA